MKKWFKNSLLVVLGFGIAHAAPALPAFGLSATSDIEINLSLSERQIFYFTSLHGYHESVEITEGVLGTNPQSRNEFATEKLYEIIQRDAERKRKVEKRNQAKVKDEAWSTR